MKGWTNDNRMMITCCNDGTRPVIFKIERIDIPETPEEEEWLARQNFHKRCFYSSCVSADWFLAARLASFSACLAAFSASRWALTAAFSASF